MKPLSLRLQAFGPFNQTEHIDFTKINADEGLFLICGDTGSGKSTLLDAISFALFDDTPGDSSQRDAFTLRSQHAEPELETWVEFDFLLRNQHYQVKRAPRQLRPRKRGDGQTERNGHAAFVQIENTKVTALADQPRKATQAIEQLLGFSSRQFRQIVVLPQGQFDRFLAAGSGDRENILAELFDSQRYQRIEQALKNSKSTLEAQLSNLHGKREALLSSVGLDDPAELEPQISELNAMRKKTLEARDNETIKLKASQQELNEGKRITELFQLRDQAQTRLRAIDDTQDEQNARRRTLENAESSSSLIDLYDGLMSRVKFQGEQKQELAKATAALEKAQKIRRQLIKKLEQLMDEKTDIVQLETESHHLNSLQRDAEAIPTLEAELKQAEGQQKAAADRVEALTNKQTESEKLLATLNETIANAETDAQSLEAIELRGKNLTSIIERHDQLAQTKALIAASNRSIENSEHQLKIQTKALEQTKKQQIHLQRCFNDGQATLLARNLQTDQPCPVCGSTEHPQYADSKIDIPEEKDLEHIRSRIESEESSVHKLRSKLATDKQFSKSENQNARTLEESLGKSSLSPRSRLLEERETLRQKFKLAQTQQESLSANMAQRAALEKALSDDKNDLDKAQSLLATVTTKLTTSQTRFNERLERLPIELRSTSAFEIKLKDVNDRLQAFHQTFKETEQAKIDAETETSRCESTITVLTTSLNDVTDELKELNQTWITRRNSAGFNDDESVQKARLDEDSIRTLKQKIEDYDRQRLEAQSQLNTHEQSCAGATAVDLALLTANEKAASEHWQSINQQLAEQEHQLKQLKHCHKLIQTGSVEQSSIEQQFSVIGKLSDVANGANPLKLTLQRFVLGVLLDEVLAAANIRLAEMTENRYALRRRQNGGDGRRKGGLELDVYDHWTSDQRPVSTLSGGESFEAALALSLGLAEVSQNHAGGIELDTLFIDEGFGSLDQDSLDRVMNTLARLQKSKRMVGIISHVNELKERIDVRLEVHSGPNGSHTEWVGTQ